MLAYAASRPRAAARPSSPNAMLVVVAVHVAAVAVLMSAKMDVARQLFTPPPKVIFIPQPKAPPPAPKPADPAPGPRQTLTPEPAQPRVIPPPLPGVPLNPGSTVEPLSLPGGGGSTPAVQPQPRPAPARGDALLVTPDHLLKPPYPQSKLLIEEEAILRLRLAIDGRGRVISVEPVGRADPVFLAAARKHLIAHWRYKPASEDGRAVASTIAVTLRFELEA